MTMIKYRSDKSPLDDVALVEYFWHQLITHTRSVHGYRAWMLQHKFQLYRLLLDGLHYRGLKRLDPTFDSVTPSQTVPPSSDDGTPGPGQRRRQCLQ